MKSPLYYVSAYLLSLFGMGLVLSGLAGVQCSGCPCSCSCVNFTVETIKGAVGVAMCFASVVMLWRDDE